MERRTFLIDGFAATAGSWLGTTGLYDRPAGKLKPAHTGKPFRMKFSPDFDIFQVIPGKDPVDQIKWGYDQGFRAWECSFLKKRPKKEQERISSTIQRLGMEFGQFVGTPDFGAVTFAGNDESARQKILGDVKESVEIAKRMNTRIVHNVLGLSHPVFPREIQMVNAIELLKRVADIYAANDMLMVMETINQRNNPYRLFLHTIPQAYALSKAVNSPAVKILFDFYHVQIQEGNLLPTLDMTWEEIGYIQVGNPPGRFDPRHGEINFKYVLQHIHDKGYRGFVGLEHGISQPGEEAEWSAIQAYRDVDPV